MSDTPTKFAFAFTNNGPIEVPNLPDLRDLEHGTFCPVYFLVLNVSPSKITFAVYKHTKGGELDVTKMPNMSFDDLSNVSIIRTNCNLFYDNGVICAHNCFGAKYRTDIHGVHWGETGLVETDLLAFAENAMKTLVPKYEFAQTALDAWTTNKQKWESDRLRKREERKKKILEQHRLHRQTIEAQEKKRQAMEDKRRKGLNPVQIKNDIAKASSSFLEIRKQIGPVICAINATRRPKKGPMKIESVISECCGIIDTPLPEDIDGLDKLHNLLIEHLKDFAYWNSVLTQTYNAYNQASSICCEEEPVVPAMW